ASQDISLTVISYFQQQSIFTVLRRIASLSQEDSADNVLHYCAKFGLEGLAQLVLKSGVSDMINQTSTHGFTPLMVAARDGHHAVARLLAQEGVDASHATNDGVTALLFAAKNGHEPIVKLLLAEEGVDASHATNDGVTALLAAALNGHESIVK